MKEHSSTIAQGREPLSTSRIPLSAITAGGLSVLINFSGPFLIVLEATRAAGLNAEQTASWVWALCMGCGLSGLILSFLTRVPIIVAWSTPGAALLIASLGGFRFSDAVGAFLLASIAAAVMGFTGLFGRALARVPAPIMSALLAGILLPFIVQTGSALGTAPLVAGTVLIVFVLGKRFFDRYAVLGALCAGVLAAYATGAVRPLKLDLAITGPVWTTPTFDLGAIISIGLPLFIVTMAAQNAPGLALLRSEGFLVNDRTIIGTISAVSAALTPFGAHAINLGAITAAICVGPESDPEPRRRYIAGISSGVLYLLAGLFGGVLIGAFQALPGELVTSIAGVALLSSALGALSTATATDSRTALSALLTLAVTMSGVVFLGIGSAFWGLLLGLAARALLGLQVPSRERPHARVSPGARP